MTSDKFQIGKKNILIYKMSITKWRVYCNTEGTFVSGYLNSSSGSPITCFHNNTHSIDITKNMCLEKINTNYTRKVIHWKIFCDTEKKYVYGYSDELSEPICCFNNTGHIVSHRPEVIEEYINNNQRIQEESTNTGGNFKAVSYKMACPVGVSNHDYSFEHPVSALSITLNTTNEHTNDNLEVQIGPDTIIGNITSDINASDTVINVSSSVLQHVKVGVYVDLYDGTNTGSLGLVTNIDSNNSTITVNTPVSQQFSVSTPTYIRMTIKTVDTFIIGFPTRYGVGKDKIGGSYVPAGTIIRVKYSNNGQSPKDFYAMIELLY